jgi:hypothetical protein
MRGYRVSYGLSDIGYGRGQDRPRKPSTAADVADGPGLEVLSMVLGLALGSCFDTISGRAGPRCLVLVRRS